MKGDFPLIDWCRLSEAFTETSNGIRRIRCALEALRVEDLRSAVAEHGGDVGKAALAAAYVANLCGRVEVFLKDIGAVLPAYAQILGQDPMEIGTCPRCGRGAHIPVDGREVVCHRECGYCTHPSVDMGRCVVCGAEAGTLDWAERRSKIPGNGVLERILLEKDGTGEPPAAEGEHGSADLN